MENKEFINQLVFAAKNGNDRCFGQLYQLYYEKIYALALTTLKNADDAQDALQSTFISAWQNLKTLDDITAFNTWLQRIALHRCYDILRKKKMPLFTDTQDEAFALAVPDEELALPQQYMERADLSARLKNIIDSLSDVQRQSVMLYYFSELSIGEIAVVMNCSEGTVKSRLYLARHSIKTEIEEQERRSGEKFYGVIGIPMLPFAQIFSAHVKGAMLSPGAAAAVYGNVLKSIAGVAVKAATASQAASAAAGGAKVATKASLLLSKKVIAIVMAVVVGVSGTVGGLMIARNHRKTSAVPQSTVEPQEKKTAQLRDFELGETEEALKTFLEGYAWGFGSAEFDCGDKKNRQLEFEGNFISYIIAEGWFYQFGQYPVESPRELSESERNDVLKRLGVDNSISAAGLREYKTKSVYWIAENIFHLEEKTVDALLQELLHDESGRVYQDGDRLYCFWGGIGGIDFIPDITWAKTDGEQYYILYDIYFDKDWNGEVLSYDSLRGDDNNDELRGTFFARVELNNIDGKLCWTMFEHTKEIPRDIFTEDAPAAFRRMSGVYARHGYGSWTTKVEVKADGSFTGDFTDINAGVGEKLVSKFSGKFTHPVKLDKYTYRAELESFTYEGKIGEKHYDESSQLTEIFTEAYGMNDGKTFYFYREGTPVAKLSDDCRNAINRSRVDTTTGLTTHYLYNFEERAGFCRYPGLNGEGWS